MQSTMFFEQLSFLWDTCPPWRLQFRHFLRPFRSLSSSATRFVFPGSSFVCLHLSLPPSLLSCFTRASFGLYKLEPDGSVRGTAARGLKTSTGRIRLGGGQGLLKIPYVRDTQSRRRQGASQNLNISFFLHPLLQKIENTTNLDLPSSKPSSTPREQCYTPSPGGKPLNDSILGVLKAYFGISKSSAMKNSRCPENKASTPILGWSVKLPWWF